MLLIAYKRFLTGEIRGMGRQRETGLVSTLRMHIPLCGQPRVPVVGRSFYAEAFLRWFERITR